MPDDTRKPHDNGSRSTDEAALSARLRRLGQRLEESQASRTPGTGSSTSAAPDSSALARGFRLSTEFVAAILVGSALGWLGDHWLRTSPWGLIVLTLLGFAAGVVNLVRAAGAGSGNPPGGNGTDRQN